MPRAISRQHWSAAHSSRHRLKACVEKPAGAGCMGGGSTRQPPAEAGGNTYFGGRRWLLAFVLPLIKMIT